jgi:hypothetical protein
MLPKFQRVRFSITCGRSICHGADGRASGSLAATQRAGPRYSPQRWRTRCFTKTSAIGARSPTIVGWHPGRGAAAGSIASRGSASQAIPALASRRSSWPGCGGAIIRIAGTASGSPRAPPTPANGIKRHDRPGAQADRAVALSRHWSGSRTGRDEGITTQLRAGAAELVAAASAGWMMTVPAMGRTNCRFVDGSHPSWLPRRNVGTDQAIRPDMR